MAQLQEQEDRQNDKFYGQHFLNSFLSNFRKIEEMF